MAERDIIDLLLEEHEEFRELFVAIERSEADIRDDLFRYLVGRLAGHEAAEEAVVHRTLRDDVPGGEQLAEQVLAEENEAERLLARMYDMDSGSTEFREAMSRLKQDVLAHAEHEERDEFPQLRSHIDLERRQKMGARFQVLRDHGPTRPHPNIPQTPEVRAAVGPFVGMFDRARDTAREVFGDGGGDTRS